MLSSDFQSLEELRPFASKCPRCSLCKFPPLVRVESARYSGICPSYEEFKVHASSTADASQYCSRLRFAKTMTFSPAPAIF